MLALRSYQLIQFYCLFSSSRSNCFGPQGLVSTKLPSSSRLFLKTVQFYGTNNVDSKISGFRPLIKWLIDEARRYWKGIFLESLLSIGSVSKSLQTGEPKNASRKMGHPNSGHHMGSSKNTLQYNSEENGLSWRNG
jgi:hypothetical protein